MSMRDTLEKMANYGRNPASDGKGLYLGTGTGLSIRSNDVLEILSQRDELLSSIKVLILNEWGFTDKDASHEKMLEFWKREKHLGRGIAQDMITALNCVMRAEEFNP